MDKTVGLRPGDRLQLKKNPPCGNSMFTVIRVGADIKLQCQGCGHVVVLEPPVLNARIKKVLDGGE